MADYFDLLPDKASRRIAEVSYVYNELVLRAPLPSVGSRLAGLLHLTDRLVGQTVANRLIGLLARRMRPSVQTLNDLPSSYVVVHADLFPTFAPALRVVKRLSRGHLILDVNGSRVGLIACRRGACEAAIQADALCRKGISRMVFIGTCLALGDLAENTFLLPTSYESQLSADSPLFARSETNPVLSANIRSELQRSHALACDVPAFICHRFLLDESRELLDELLRLGFRAIEMEGIGFAWAMNRSNGAFASVLLPLDRYLSNGFLEPLNTSSAAYLTVARQLPVAIQAALSVLR